MRIIVETGKHGSNYHDASTNDALSKSAMAILKERFDAGYWYFEDQDPDWYEEARQLCEGELDDYPVTTGRRRIGESGWGSIKMPKSWQLLSSRADWQYEHVELVEAVEH